jgi:hypothetical protein
MPVKYENNIAIYERVAKKLGLDCEYIHSSHKKKPLLISNDKKFFLMNTGYPGFYPSVSRFSAYLTANKILSQKILQKFSYRVIITTPIHVRDYLSEEELLLDVKQKNLLFPLLIKPNTGQDGDDISICETTEQLEAVCIAFFTKKHDFLMQPIITQNEYRILVVDHELVLIHSKRNQRVTGDGKTSIGTLLSKIPESKKSYVIIGWQHNKRKTTMESVLPTGDHFDYHITKIPSADVYYKDNFPPEVTAWALKLSQTLSSPVVGIDVFVPGDITDTDSYTIIELNSNPAVYYLPKRCNDFTTPYLIVEKVLKNYFNLN